MYEALNNRVVATPIEEETTTASGIILTSDDKKACVAFKVVATNEQTKKLQDRIVYAEGRYVNHALPPGPDGETYVVIPFEDILAVKV